MKKLAKKKTSKKSSVKKKVAKKVNPSLREKSKSGRDFRESSKHESLKMGDYYERLNDLADKIQKKKEKDYPINGYPRWRAIEDAGYQLEKERYLK